MKLRRLNVTFKSINALILGELVLSATFNVRKR